MGRFLYAILWTMLSATEGHYMSAIVRQNPSAQAAVNLTTTLSSQTTDKSPIGIPLIAASRSEKT